MRRREPRTTTTTTYRSVAIRHPAGHRDAARLIGARRVPGLRPVEPAIDGSGQGSSPVAALKVLRPHRMGDVKARAFYKAVTVDAGAMLEELLDLLEELDVTYCVVGGQAVNAYVDPLVSLDLDLVVAAADLERVLGALPAGTEVDRFPHSVNLAFPGSDLRIQFQTDPRYVTFPERASTRPILGIAMRVASAEDVLAGKIWAASDQTRRPSKRQKDLADIARLIERFPEMRERVPASVLEKLI